MVFSHNWAACILVGCLVLSTEERRNFFYANKTSTLILSVETSVQLEGRSISSSKCQSAEMFCTIHQTVETLVAFIWQHYQQCNDTKLVEKPSNRASFLSLSGSWPSPVHQPWVSWSICYIKWTAGMNYLLLSLPLDLVCLRALH